MPSKLPLIASEISIKASSNDGVASTPTIMRTVNDSLPFSVICNLLSLIYYVELGIANAR